MHLYSRRRIIYPMPTGRTPGALYRATPSQDGCILARHYVQWASPSSICSTRRIYRCTITWDLLHPILLIRQNLQYVSPPLQHLIQKCKGGPHPVFLHITQRFSKWGLQRLFTEVVDPSHVVPHIPILQSWYMHHSFYAPPPPSWIVYICTTCIIFPYSSVWFQANISLSSCDAADPPFLGPPSLPCPYIVLLSNRAVKWSWYKKSICCSIHVWMLF